MTADESIAMFLCGAGCQPVSHERGAHRGKDESRAQLFVVQAGSLRRVGNPPARAGTSNPTLEGAADCESACRLVCTSTLGAALEAASFRHLPFFRCPKPVLSTQESQRGRPRRPAPL